MLRLHCSLLTFRSGFDSLGTHCATAQLAGLAPEWTGSELLPRHVSVRIRRDPRVAGAGPALRIDVSEGDGVRVPFHRGDACSSPTDWRRHLLFANEAHVDGRESSKLQVAGSRPVIRSLEDEARMDRARASKLRAAARQRRSIRPSSAPSLRVFPACHRRGQVEQPRVSRAVRVRTRGRRVRRQIRRATQCGMTGIAGVRRSRECPSPHNMSAVCPLVPGSSDGRAGGCYPLRLRWFESSPGSNVADVRAAPRIEGVRAGNLPVQNISTALQFALFTRCGLSTQLGSSGHRPAHGQRECLNQCLSATRRQALARFAKWYCPGLVNRSRPFDSTIWHTARRRRPACSVENGAARALPRCPSQVMV